ncbi:MAG: aspartyl protease family protein [Candidatus Eisenbacteria bacterium]|nr:aspartyl protease family protein [Candidatus Eisenbacteria bacterium]
MIRIPTIVVVLPLAVAALALGATLAVAAPPRTPAPPPLEDRGAALARLDSLQSIVRLEEARVRKAPGDEAGWDRLARAWFQVGDHEKAARCIDRARAAGAAEYDTWILSGRAARGEGRFAEAIEWLDRAVRAKPDDWEANEDLGVALYLAGRYREAAERWERAHLAPESGSPDRSGLIAALRRLREPAYALSGRGRERLAFVPVAARGALAVRVRIQGRGPFLMRVDMGSAETVLGRSLARELGLAIETGGESGAFVGDQPVVLDYAVLDSLALGATIVHDLPVAVSDDAGLGRPVTDLDRGGGRRVTDLDRGTGDVRGTIGFELLRRFRFCVDFPDSALILEPLPAAAPPVPRDPHPGAPRSAATASASDSAPAWLPRGRAGAAIQVGHAAHRLPLLIRGTHLLVVPVRLGSGPERTFVLDTGAPGSAVAAPMSTLVEAGIAVDTSRVLTGATAAGPVAYYACSVPRVCAGSACRDSLTGTYGIFPPRLETNPNFRVAGLLSRGFLDRYRLGVDLARREVWLIEP